MPSKTQQISLNENKKNIEKENFVSETTSSTVTTTPDKNEDNNPTTPLSSEDNDSTMPLSSYNKILEKTTSAIKNLVNSSLELTKNMILLPLELTKNVIRNCKKPHKVLFENTIMEEKTNENTNIGNQQQTSPEELKTPPLETK